MMPPAPRLLLVEFFRGALRRNEKSMLFPFFQGLARAHGCEPLWLCFGGDIGHVDPGSTRQALCALLPPKDLQALAGYLRRFRPTHVLTSDPLCPEARRLLTARTPPPKHLVTPQIGRMPGGPGASVRHGDITRCGWFLDWIGARNTGLAERRIVEHAVPDYSAVLANPSARAASPLITVVGGTLCANRRMLKDNPHFAGLDLSGRSDRGCSFCRVTMMPSYTSPRADILALIETQFRRILKTAGTAGRDKGRYEFFDIHAFWKFDEVFEIVLRLRVPPAIFLFNPRIDDVLRVRRRIERIMPALARAGHEIRILSMGVENFSERENARFNKGISLAQVDEFLALTDKWSHAYGNVFKPFKGGNEIVEIGMIMFSPWTTLADIRVNLACAVARRFPEQGYWLYSILLIEPLSAIARLARKDGVLADRFADRGQVYGLLKNEGEIPLTAWRFKDARIADYFALLVRVCAADRDGADCSFFRNDPLFALAASLYLEAKNRAQTSPLQVALALLDLMESATAHRSREALLREAVGRAKPLSPTLPVPPRKSPFSAEAKAVASVVDRLKDSRPALLAGMGFEPVEEIVLQGTRRIRLAYARPGRSLVVDLLDARSDAPCFLRSRHFRAVYHDDAQPPSARERAQWDLLLRLIDAAVDRAQRAGRKPTMSPRAPGTTKRR